MASDLTKKLIPLICEVFTRLCKEHWDIENYSSSKRAKDVRGWYKLIDVRFGQKPLDKVKIAEVKVWHQSMSSTPAQANKALQVLNMIFEFAEVNGLYDGLNPCLATKKFREQSRKRLATPEELVRILAILKQNIFADAQASTFLLAIIYSGARPISLERAKWSQLQKREDGFGVFVFTGKSSFKSGDEETVIFPPSLMELLEKLPGLNKDGLIFNIKMPRGLWKRIQNEVGCHDLWARDLRRTFATIGFSSGVDKNVVGKLLNHSSPKTTEIYAKLNYDARIEAVETITKELKKVGG